jgi:heat shock protein HslJ
MTDEQMDARLRSAGAAWRAAQPTVLVEPPPQPEPLGLPRQVPHRLRRRTGLLISAAAVAAALAAGLAVVVTGLGGNPHRTADVAGLTGVVWRFVGYGDAAPRTNSTATLVFNSDGTFVADDACQTIGGPVDAQDGQLFFNPRQVRQRPCTDTAGELAFGAQAMDVFAGLSPYTLSDDQLTIHSSRAMHFRAAPGLPRPTLDVPSVEDATWRLVTVTDASGKQLAVPAGAATFHFDGSQLTASDGCNTLSGDGELDGRTFSVAKGNGLSATEIGCPAGEQASVAVIDAVLGGDPRWTLTGATLVLHRAGAGTLSYRWVPDDAAATDAATVIGRSWQLRSFAGEPVTAAVRLHIDASGVATGTDGCRTFRLAHATLGPGTLQLPTAPRAGKGCRQSIAATFDSFLAEKPALWSIRDGKLLIFGGGAQAFSLVFTPDRPVPPAAGPTIEGTWRLVEISHESASSGSGEAGPFGVTLTLTPDTFRLGSRCATYAGDVARLGATLVFSHVRRLAGSGCKDNGAQEAALLRGSVHWSFDSGGLDLAKNHTTLTFAR